MGAPGTSTWDDPVNGPHRPGSTDFNGASLVDNANFPPPTTGSHPTSAMMNTQSLNAVSVGQVVPNVTASVNAGVGPTFAFVASCIKAINLSGGMSVYRVSAGVYWVTWANNAAMPAQVAQDKAFLNLALGAHNYSIAAVRGAYNPGGGAVPGVNVTTTQDGVLTDLPFTVDIM